MNASAFLAMASMSLGSPLGGLAGAGNAASANARAGRASKPNARVLMVASFPGTEGYRNVDHAGSAPERSQRSGTWGTCQTDPAPSQRAAPAGPASNERS